MFQSRDFFLNNGISEFWRLAPELSIVQAALLMVDEDPSGYWATVENRVDQPEGYDAAKNVLLAALRTREVTGKFACYSETSHDSFGNEIVFEVSDTCDPNKTFINVESLRTWLESKGAQLPFFTECHRPSGFRDSLNERYSPKLAAAVAAWESVPSSDLKGTPKQQLKIWLRLNAETYGLVNEDGKPKEKVIEDLAQVANWATGGGAPRKAEASPSENLDEEIPF